MKFVADGMLGKLTRWLRMLGQDVIYSVEFDDPKLLELAKREDRVLLTKDLELYKLTIGKGMDAYYFEGKTEPEQLAEIAKRYGLLLIVEIDKSHCPICNTQLKPTLKEQIKVSLEKNTFNYYDKFWKCTNCGQIYWQGAHWSRINNTLKQAQIKLQKLEEKN